MVNVISIVFSLSAAAAVAVASSGEHDFVARGAHNHLAHRRGAAAAAAAQDVSPRADALAKRATNKKPRCAAKPKPSTTSHHTTSTQKAKPTHKAAVVEEPSPSPTPEPKPSPKPSPKPDPPAPKPSPKPDPPSGGGVLSDSTKSGDGTFFGAGEVACGGSYSPNDMIAAASYIFWENYPGNTANPNESPICGRKVVASYQGKSVEVQIVDKCMGCEKEFSLDFSPAAFKQLADPGLGRIPITWTWA